MSLKVWLPLNGNLKNQGLSSATIIASGAEAISGGKLGGQTYSFDGSDDYISIDSSSLYDCFKGGEYPFTIAMWIYFNETTGGRGVLFGDYNLSGAINFNLELNSGSNWNNDIRFYWASSPDYRATNTAITSNTWVHLAVTYSGTQLKFYRNGILVNTRDGTLDSKNKTSGAFYLGRDSRTGATAFNGKLNDVRIYDECLSDKEIKEIYKTLILHYKLNNSVIVKDFSGYGNQATISDYLMPNPDTPIYDNSIYFYANAVNIITPTIDFSGLADNFTFSWWAKKPSSTMNGKMAWGFKDGNRLNVYPTSSKFCCNTGDGSNNAYKNGSSTIPFSPYDNGEWHHYAMTGDGTDNKLYIDGEYKGTAQTYKGITGTQIVLSGWDTGTSYKWTGGWLSDFRIYATALTAEDILQLSKTRIIIDNKQNLYSYDFQENNYAELDYLEATGTQYIVTDVPMNKVKRISCKFQYSDLTTDQGLFGWAVQGERTSFYFCVKASNSRFGMYTYNAGNLQNANTSVNTFETDILDNYWILNTTKSHLGSYELSITETDTLPLFALRNDNAASGFKNFSKVKLYYIKFYNNLGQLIGDFIPALDLNNVACLYDKITQQFYYNQGTGDFSYGNITKDMRNKLKIQKNGVLGNQNFEECTAIFPKGYKKLEYIESTGTQYIDTGTIFDYNTTEIIFDFQLSGGQNNINKHFCSTGSINNDNHHYILYMEMGASAMGAYFSSEDSTPYRKPYYKTPMDDDRHIIKYNSNNHRVYLDETSKAGNASSTRTNSFPMYIFAQNANGTEASNNCLAKLYNFKITNIQNNTLIRNFVPAEDKNGIACLYDTVSNTTFYNQGTGSFVKGSYVTPGPNTYYDKVQLYNNKVISNNFYEI